MLRSSEILIHHCTHINSREQGSHLWNVMFFPSWFYIYGTKQVNEAKFSRNGGWVASCAIWHSARHVWNLGGVIRRVNKHQTASLNLSCCFIGGQMLWYGLRFRNGKFKTENYKWLDGAAHPFFKQKSPGCYLGKVWLTEAQHAEGTKFCAWGEIELVWEKGLDYFRCFGSTRY